MRPPVWFNMPLADIMNRVHNRKQSFAHKRSRRKTVLVIVIFALAIVLFGAGLVLFEKRLRQPEGLGDSGEWGWNEPGEEVRLKIGDSRVSYTDAVDAYLVIGTDATGSTPDAAQGFNGNMADFLILLLVNRTNGRFGFVQLDRDTMMDVPVLGANGEEAGTSYEQLCIAHWYGQNEEQRNRNTVTAVSRLFGGLPIKGYYSINMKDMDRVNHAVGGVEVKIEDDLTSIDPAMKPGAVVTLADDQVEQYLRARRTVGDGTNISRMRRQRQYLQNLYSLVTGRLKKNANYINEIYDEISEVVDSDLPAREVSQLTAEIMKFENLGFMSIDGESRKGEASYDGEVHAEFYPDTESILKTLREFADISDGWG